MTRPSIARRPKSNLEKILKLKSLEKIKKNLKIQFWQLVEKRWQKCETKKTCEKNKRNGTKSHFMRYPFLFSGLAWSKNLEKNAENYEENFTNDFVIEFEGNRTFLEQI